MCAARLNSSNAAAKAVFHWLRESTDLIFRSWVSNLRLQTETGFSRDAALMLAQRRSMLRHIVRRQLEVQWTCNLQWMIAGGSDNPVGLQAASIVAARHGNLV
jgi:hypothetical protein